MNPLSVVTDFQFDGADQRLVREAAGPQSRVEFARDVASLRLALGTADVLCTFRPPADILRIAPRLRWLQFPGAGVDSLRSLGLLRAGLPFVITTASSANAESAAEYVLSLMLIFARKWDEMIRLQERKVWATGQKWGELRGFELGGKTLGIIGLGAIGRALSPLARALRMRVIGLRGRSVAGEADPDCDALFGSDQIAELLAESDIALVAVPLTPATVDLIGERELRAMRPNAFLINVSRGEVVHEPSLIRALRERWIAGAGLDVTATEPLPPTSPLWTFPGVIITPHLSSLTTGYSHRLAHLFAENLARWRQDQPLLNLVEPDRE